jgi:hypothetical protein
MNTGDPRNNQSKSFVVTLWVVQGFLALTFVGGGIWKLVTPLPTLGTIIPWSVEVAPSFFYATATFDLLGGIGILLPSLLGIFPLLARLAALGCAALQTSAIIFHLSRGEGSNTYFNFLLVGLSLLIFWGRGPSGSAGRILD